MISGLGVIAGGDGGAGDVLDEPPGGPPAGATCGRPALDDEGGGFAADAAAGFATEPGAELGDALTVVGACAPGTVAAVEIELDGGATSGPGALAGGGGGFGAVADDDAAAPGGVPGRAA